MITTQQSVPTLRFKDEQGRYYPDWEIFKLGFIAECLDNNRIPLNETERNKRKGSIPYWGANGILDYVNDYIFDETVVLLAEDGGYFDEFHTRPIASISYGKSWVNNHAHVLRAKKKVSINEYLYYSLVHKNILGYVNGGTRAKLNKSEMLKIPLPIPSLEEQQKIAAFLSSVDTKIEQLNKKKALLEQYKKGMMQKLFSQEIRFKDEQGKDYPDWEIVALGDTKSLEKHSFTGGPFGSNLKNEDYTNEGVRIIQLQNIGDGVFNDDYRIYTSSAKADQLKSCNIFPGEIIISKMGDPVARACLIPANKDDRYLMASDGIRLSVDPKKYDCKFIHDSINHSDFRRKAVSHSTGSTRRRIGLTDLRKLKLFAPQLKEQQKIAAFLSSVDKKIDLVAKQLNQAQTFKKGLLQQMFV